LAIIFLLLGSDSLAKEINIYFPYFAGHQYQVAELMIDRLT